ncbi:unnamed protein product [Alopecurus aequalis]
MDQLEAVRQVPDDVIACILRRLNPRSLAASRCVCKDWRAVIDTQSLLRADLLPLSVYGIFFVKENLLGRLEFFARPLMEHKIADKFDIPWHDQYDVLDHCNGLLLFKEWVVNPATRQCVALPPPPPPCMGMEDFYDRRHLVFDPTVSPHYDVLSIPVVPHELGNQTKFTMETEWPPSPFTMSVFSSRTRRWEKRSFIRQGEGTGTTIADMKFSWKYRYAVCWRDALYVHCQDGSIMRITLSSQKYQVIPSPTDSNVAAGTYLYLGKSTKGVYCALICNEAQRLHIWLLHEFCGQKEWVLKKDVTIQPIVRIMYQDFGHHNYGLWTLQKNPYPGGFDNEPIVEKKFEWDLDTGITLEAAAMIKNDTYADMRILGFHPYKEILFLWTNSHRTIVG